MQTRSDLPFSHKQLKNMRPAYLRNAVTTGRYPEFLVDRLFLRIVRLPPGGYRVLATSRETERQMRSSHHYVATIFINLWPIVVLEFGSRTERPLERRAVWLPGERIVVRPIYPEVRTAYQLLLARKINQRDT